MPHQGPPVELAEGDIAIVSGGNPHTVADLPSTEPTCIVTSATCCTDAEGIDISSETALGPIQYGFQDDGSHLLLSGSYEAEGEVSRRLLSVLPEVVIVPASDYRSPLVTLGVEEIACDEPGQQVVVDRLLDLALISALRHWFSHSPTRESAWYRAHSDPIVGQALRLMHSDPAREWTVESLAAKCGVSRAALARRFTELVGQSPKAYLTSWRISLAADLLRSSEDTVASIARRVGYSSTFALSVAFKRLRQQTPTDYRLGLSNNKQPAQ